MPGLDRLKCPGAVNTATAVDPFLPTPQLPIQGGSLLVDPPGCTSQLGVCMTQGDALVYTNTTDEMKAVPVYLQWRTKVNA